jgi:DNA repair protein RadA/Sms
MARGAPNFVCQNCGAVYGRWQGKCDQCEEWNTIAEENAAANRGPGRAPRKGRKFALEPLAGESHEAPRLASGIVEFDRVTGGGLVRGSVLLVGGDPGIGKSTLLIQAAASLARAGQRTVYISGEEAVAQVRLRAERLGLSAAPVELAAETAVEDIVATLSEGKTPRLVVIDSIQTMWTDAIESAPGTVSQVRGAAQVLIRYAKRSGATVVLVGHVTKDGQIAGPRVVEHMVDAVLSFEGEGPHHFRILRAIKNRFGPTDEIGVFEMTGGGLAEVANPSELFLSERDLGTPGTAVFAGIEGTRPLLVEMQALVAPAGSGRMGPEPPVHGSRGTGGPLWGASFRPRCLSQRRWRAAHSGAGSRPRCRREPGLVPNQRSPPPGRRLFRGSFAVGRDSTRRSNIPAPQGGAEARFCPCGAARRGARGSP